MRCVALLWARAPVAPLGRAQHGAARAYRLALASTLAPLGATAQWNCFGNGCFASCGSQMPAMQLSAARLQSSNSCAPDQHDLQQEEVPNLTGSNTGSSCTTNTITLDQLLKSSPIAANATSSSSSSARQQQQRQLTEQLLSELFDAELEQRLVTAAAAAAAAARGNTTAAGHSQHQTTPIADTADQVPQVTYPPYQMQTQQQQQQPGVVSTQQQQQQQSNAGQTDGSRPGHVSGCSLMGSAADQWTPLPGPAFARRRLPSQVQQLLEQTGVPPATAAAAAAQAADSPASAAAAAAGPSSTSSNTRSRTRAAAGAQQQQQQQRAAPEHYLLVLSRLQRKQLISLLEDCQAPTYGDKELLLRRLVLLLQEQAAAAAGGAGSEPQGFQVGSWAEGEDGFRVLLGAAAGEAAYNSSTRTSGASQAAAAEAATTVGVADTLKQQQQWRQRGNSLTHQVQAAAAARQQLLDAVLDAHQVGSWLLAARAQDVCVINVSGRAGLHQQLVVATGLSQRHAHACAEAVAWQLKEKAKAHLAQQQQQQWVLAEQQQQQPLAEDMQAEHFLPSLPVLGDASSDWAVLDAGTVVVHVLTERARRFYNLEGLWGGPQGRFIRRLKPEQVVETKDTIGRDAAAGSV